MYEWRKMNEVEREEVLRIRKGRKLPWHSPPHLEFEGDVSFIITAACFEHAPIIGKNPERIVGCEEKLLEICENADAKIFAWCILPNHYHLLVRTDNIKLLKKEIGRFHGRSSRVWNQEDDTPGRKIWFNFFDRDMRSARHFWASLNYVNNNAVKHGYVDRWQDWVFSSARRYLSEFGKEKAEYIWRKYPVLDYGKDWDIY
jgi:putative transposase